jgi:putative transposase
VLDILIPEAGAFYVMDRGYVDFARLYALHQSGGFFATLLAVANSAEFGHLLPSQIVPRLADQQRYIASESTFYRVLRAENQLTHRRSERVAQKRSKPRAVCATEPDQLFSWDITYLPTTIHGIYLYLYLYLDVFSRKIVAWQIYAEENGENASEVMKDLFVIRSMIRRPLI